MDTNTAIPAYRFFIEAGISNDEAYERFMQMDIDSEKVKTEKIKEIFGWQGLREDTILALKNEVGLSCREISRHMEGVSSSTIHRILQKAGPDNP